MNNGGKVWLFQKEGLVANQSRKDILAGHDEEDIPVSVVLDDHKCVARNSDESLDLLIVAAILDNNCP